MVYITSHLRLLGHLWILSLSKYMMGGKYCSVLCLVAQSCHTFCNPMQPHGTPWNPKGTHQVPLSMGFSRQEYWSGLPWPPPWDLPNPGIEPRYLALQEDSLPSEPSVLVVQSHPTLCNPIDYSPPGSSVHGIFQARILEWVAISFPEPPGKPKYCSAAAAAAATVKSLQWCLTLCDPTDSSPPGSPVPGILQARTLEWVAISFSNAWKWKVKVKSLSRVRLLATLWTAAHQAPPSMGYSRQEYWSGLPLPSPKYCSRGI